MLLNDLDAVLRNAGLAVTEAAGWQGHNHGQLSSVECIVIHHTAGPASGDYPSYNVVRNGRAGLPGPLAQLGVGRSGKVYVFSNGVAWHAGVVRASWMDNYHAIGIEVESVGTGPAWPAVQVNATAKATAALCRKYGVPVSRVLGHKEICSPPGRKVDPIGIPGGMPAFRTLVQKYLRGDDVMNEQQYAVLVETQRRVTLARATTDQVKALVDTLEPSVNAVKADAAQLKEQLVALSQQVAALGSGGVNVDQLAAQVAAALGPVVAGQVADELNRRLAD